MRVHASAQALAPARSVLCHIHTRQLHVFVGEKLLPPDGGGGGAAQDIVDSVQRFLVAAAAVAPPPQHAERGGTLLLEDLAIGAVSIDYGMGATNPVDHVSFFGRKTEHGVSSVSGFKIRADDVSCLVPQHFREEYIRVFCRSHDSAKVALAVHAFNAWSKSMAPAPAQNTVKVQSE